MTGLDEVAELAPDELVFTRLEPGAGRARSGGYQVAHASSGISAAESSELVGLLNSFDVERHAVRHQFSALASGRLAISVFTRVVGDPRFMDRERRNVYIAHVAVLDRGAFDRLGADPCGLLDAAFFVRDAQALVERYFEPGSRPAANSTTLRAAAASTVDDLAVPRAAALAIVDAAAAAATGVARRIELRGAPEQVLRFLRSVVGLVDERHRAHCTFDTAVDRAHVQVDRFLVAGTAAGLSPRRPTYIECEGATAHASPIDQTPPSLYRMWLTRRWPEGGHRPPDDVARSAARACAALEDGDGAARRFDIARLDLIAVAEVCETHPSLVTRKAMQWLTAALGERIGMHVVQRVGNDPMFLLRAAANQVEPIELSDAARRALEAGLRPDGKRDWRVLADLAGMAEDWVLLHRVATLAPKPDRKLRDEALGRMGPDQFDEAARLAGVELPWTDFVWPNHLDRLAARLSEWPIDGETAVELVRAAIDAGSKAELSPLLVRLASQPSETLAEITKRLDRVQEWIAPDVLAPYVAARSASRPGLLSRMLHRSPSDRKDAST